MHIFPNKTGGLEKNSHPGRIPRRTKKLPSGIGLQKLKVCRKESRKLEERHDLHQRNSSHRAVTDF